ncbi:WD40-repeat-containing domain protein [Phycomyces nitens]|nr:WD40-repeat-containing domain protein [Phycomyces nitens]
MMVVPHPVAMRELLGVEDSETLYLQIKEARCTFNLPGINPTAISWGGHSRISCGSSSGNVIIWDAEGALANGLEQDDKLGQSERMIFNAIVHDSAVNGIVWHGRINPIEYATSSLDGNLKICNTRDPNISITIMRVRALMYPPVWPQYSTNICVCDADNCLQTMYLANESNFKITLRHFDSIGKVWEMAASESHTFLAASSADGLVRICNIHQRRRKGLPHTQRVIYAVLYDKDTNTYSYVDGVRRLECDFSKFLPTSNRFVESNYLISKVTWNPNNIASPWLASGSVAGICRVDFCGVGHQWLED